MNRAIGSTRGCILKGAAVTCPYDAGAFARGCPNCSWEYVTFWLELLEEDTLELIVLCVGAEADECSVAEIGDSPSSWALIESPDEEG